MMVIYSVGVGEVSDREGTKDGLVRVCSVVVLVVIGTVSVVEMVGPDASAEDVRVRTWFVYLEQLLLFSTVPARLNHQEHFHACVHPPTHPPFIKYSFCHPPIHHSPIQLAIKQPTNPPSIQQTNQSLIQRAMPTIQRTTHPSIRPPTHPSNQPSSSSQRTAYPSIHPPTYPPIQPTN